MEAILRGYHVESCVRVESRSDEAEYTRFWLDRITSRPSEKAIHRELEIRGDEPATNHSPLAISHSPLHPEVYDVPNTETENDGKEVGRQSCQRSQIAQAGPERPDPQREPPNESLKTKGRQKKDVKNEGTSQ